MHLSPRECCRELLESVWLPPPFFLSLPAYAKLARIPEVAFWTLVQGCSLGQRHTCFGYLRDLSSSSSDVTRISKFTSFRFRTRFRSRLKSLCHQPPKITLVSPPQPLMPSFRPQFGIRCISRFKSTTNLRNQLSSIMSSSCLNPRLKPAYLITSI